MEQERKISIKGMVCERCITTVQDQLREIGFEVKSIGLGEVTIISPDPNADLDKVEERLERLGFSLLEDKKEKLVKEIKELVSKVYSGEYDFPEKFRFSDLIERQCIKTYDAISAAFSSQEGVTLEKYILNYRVEKVKELLLYSNQSLADISFNLGFSSVAHLSRQFKNQTGLTITHFREVRKEKELLAS
jgi:YesN/AraC family two-component response regulator